MTQRRLVYKEVDSLYVDGLSGRELLETLNGLDKEYGLENVLFSKEQYGYSDGEYISIKVHREETDAELDARLKLEALISQRRDQSDREQYERLKRKFKNK